MLLLLQQIQVHLYMKNPGPLWLERHRQMAQRHGPLHTQTINYEYGALFSYDQAKWVFCLKTCPGPRELWHLEPPLALG